jgi:hypothetical protein
VLETTGVVLLVAVIEVRIDSGLQLFDGFELQGASAWVLLIVCVGVAF